MTLAAVLTSLDSVPESLREEYTQGNDGKFYLDLDGTITTHTAILPLSNSLRNVKKEKQELQAKLTAAEARIRGLPDDFDPAAYQAIVDELETLKKDPNRDKDTETQLASIRQQYEQRIRAAEEKRVADLAAKDEEIAERDRVIETTVVDHGLSESLVKAGVDPRFLAASKALLRRQVKLKREDDGSRKAVVETDLGELEVSQYVENWSKSDEGKAFVVPAKGAGAPGSKDTGRQETNPWAAGTVNLTEQGKIIQTDKTKAERLMKAAGRTPDQIRIALS